MPKAIVSENLEKIEGVTRTWFEWVRVDSHLVNELVVEVDFDTDPNSSDFNRSAIDEIEAESIRILRQGTMSVSHLRIVPKRR
jgi:hypothetical protein